MNGRGGVLTAMLLMVMTAVFAEGQTCAEPFAPVDDRQVVETLRGRPTDPVWLETKRLRALLRDDPQRLDVAVSLARRYIEQSRIDADPRYLGRAESVLGPWWALATPPAPVRLVRATIRQSLHDFDGALADLEALLRADPRQAQAWLTAAVIYQVQGRYAEARRHCAPLIGLAGDVVTATCAASVGSMHGHAVSSYELLTRTVERQGGANPSERQWAWTLLGEMASRLGRTNDAESHFQAALAVGIKDPYLLGAYADWLLDHGRPADVLSLLQAERKVDALLLRLVLAEWQMKRAEAVLDREILEARFEAARRRGDRTHLREEARYVLHVLKEAERALALAETNWRVQKEPADARLLLEAALAAGQPLVAHPAVAWFRANRVEDATLEPLVKQVEWRHG